MTGKLNGFKPTLGAAIAAMVILAGIVGTWSVNAYRLGDHEKRLTKVEELVGTMREDVAAIRAVVAPRQQSEPHGG